MTHTLTSQQRLNRLRAALRDDQRSRSVALADRLDRCAVDWRGRYECRSPACPHCRRRHIARETRWIGQSFGHLRNEDLAFVSVVIGATAEVETIGDMIRRNRDSTRKRIAACRQHSQGWNDVFAACWHEIDAVGAHHIPMLPPKRRKLIEQIAPLSFDSVVPAWIPSFHGIVHRNGMEVGDIACELRHQWKLPGQVDVRGFDLARPLGENLANLTSYSNKFSTSIALKDGVKDEWLVPWEVEFYGWLQASQRNPFEALRLTVNPSREIDLSNVECIHDRIKYREPLPCSFSRITMYEYTGAAA